MENRATGAGGVGELSIRKDGGGGGAKGVGGKREGRGFLVDTESSHGFRGGTKGKRRKEKKEERASSSERTRPVIAPPECVRKETFFRITSEKRKEVENTTTASHLGSKRGSN